MLLLLAFSCNPTQPSVAIAAPSATAPSVSMDRFMREFMDLHNCNAPTPLTQYVSEKGLTTRSIPTQGQQINNFCYDNWSIVSYNPTRSGTEVVATIAGSSYCHELTYKVIEEAGGYRLVPGNWHSDVSYVDPWISERRDISDSTCPSSSGSTTTTGGVNASSPREFMNGFMDLNNCNGTGLEYLSSSHMTSRSIPTYGIEVNNFCYDSWSITSEQATGQGTNFTATIGNEYYCHALTYTVVGSSGSYSLIPGTYHSDTSFVDPWVSESRDVTDPSCANSTAAPTTTTTTSGSGTDSFIENFLSVNNCEAPTPLTSYLSEKELIGRSIPTYGQQINNFCYDGWNIHSKQTNGATTVYKATVGNPGGFCHELTYEVISEAGGYRLVPGTWHDGVSYVDPWVAERRDLGDSTCPTTSGAQNTYTSGSLFTPPSNNTASPGADGFMVDFVSLNNCNGPTPTTSYVSRNGMNAKSIPHTETINNFCYDAWNVFSREQQSGKVVYKAMISQPGQWCNELTYEVVEEDGGYRMMPGTHHSDVNYVDPWVAENRSVTSPHCPTSAGAHNSFTPGTTSTVVTTPPVLTGPVTDPNAFLATWKEAGNGCTEANPSVSYISPSGLQAMGLDPAGVMVNNFCYEVWRETSSRKTPEGTEYTVIIGMPQSWCHRVTYVVTADGLKPGEWHSDTGYLDPWVKADQWIEDPACP